jgi:hypothetical protein
VVLFSCQRSKVAVVVSHLILPPPGSSLMVLAVLPPQVLPAPHRHRGRSIGA